MQIVIKKITIGTMIFAMLIQTAPQRPVNADTATHVHDEICYGGVCHTAHGAGCYSSRSVQKYCTGHWETVNVVRDIEFDIRERRFYCSNRKCRYYKNGDYGNSIKEEEYLRNNSYGDYYYRGYHITDSVVCDGCGRSYGAGTTGDLKIRYYYCNNRRCGYYYEGDPIENYVKREYYWDPEGPSYSGYRCPGCDRRCGTRTVSETKTEDVLQVKCTGCGATKYLIDSGSYEPNHRERGRVHGDTTVSESYLSCTKELGAYYDEAGRKCECVCDKIVTRAIAEEETQILRPGEEVNCRGVVMTYNGQWHEVTAAKHDIGDYRINNYFVDNCTVEEYKIPLDEELFPFYYDKETGKRVKGRSYYKITVYRKAPEFEIKIKSSEGGKVLALSSDINSSEGKKFAEGDEAEIVVTPFYGWYIKNLFINRERIVTEGKEEVTIKIKMPNEDLIIDAEFERKKCRICFDPSGGNWNGMTGVVKREAVYGRRFVDRNAFPWDPVREGYVFKGWYDDENFKTDPTDICISTEDLKLHAHWLDAKSVTKEIEFEDVLMLQMPAEIDGFDFDKETFWRLEEKNGNGRGEVFKTDEPLRVSEDFRIFGRWDPKKYKITFEPNGGTSDKELSFKEVTFHHLVGELPKVSKDGALFAGWFTDIFDGIMITETDAYMFARDMLLFAHWTEDDGSAAVIDAKIYALNNERNMARNDEGVVICKAGNRLSFVLNAELPKEAKPPVTVKVTPKYGIIRNGKTEDVHVFSTGRLGDRIVMFYERGKDQDDTLVFSHEETKFSFSFHWVLPHLSYVVANEAYDELIEYSGISTLSGFEPFFIKNTDLQTSFDIVITDSEGKEYRNEEPVKAIIKIE